MAGRATLAPQAAGMSSFRKPPKAKSHLRRRKRRDNESSDDEDAGGQQTSAAGVTGNSAGASSASAVAQRLREVRDEQRIRRRAAGTDVRHTMTARALQDDDGILVTNRAGLLRVSPHYVNEEAEVDALLAALERRL